MHGALIRWSGATGLASSRCFWNRPAYFPSRLSANSTTCSTRRARTASPSSSTFSRVIVRCILAASTLEGGKTAAKSVMAAVAAHREEFEFDHHCSGPNLDATPNDIISRIERYSGVKLAKAFAIPDLDREVKWHCKYARQNGIHVSPTFMVDGLVQPDLSSGDPVADWVARLSDH